MKENIRSLIKKNDNPGKVSSVNEEISKYSSKAFFHLLNLFRALDIRYVLSRDLF